MRSFTAILIAFYCAIASVIAFPSIQKRCTINDMYGKHRLVTYVVDWEIPTINWDQLDHIAYAFAEPNSEGTLESFTESSLKNRK
jgi:GH18 family chitinase